MAEPISGKPTEEQRKLFSELQMLFGSKSLEQANHLSGLGLCLSALANDEGLTREQRQHVYQKASEHLAQLLEMLLSPGESARMIECAKRLDAAIETWMLDGIEARDGLPPA